MLNIAPQKNLALSSFVRTGAASEYDFYNMREKPNQLFCLGTISL